MAPIYKDLAKKYKDNKKLLIAEVDATKDKIPGIEISGFPTIYFWKAGTKGKVEFDGQRTIEAFEEFMSKHGKYFKKKEIGKSDL